MTLCPLHLEAIYKTFSNAICGSFNERQVLSLLSPNLEDYELATADLDVVRS